VRHLTGCVRAFTDVVHPIQIMDTKVVSHVKLPYNRIYVPQDFNESTDNRKLNGEPFTRPDAPLMLCTDSRVTSKLASINKKGSGSIKVKGIPLDYDYALDVKGNECIDASVTVPGSFNYNHDYGANAIKKILNLGMV